MNDMPCPCELAGHPIKGCEKHWPAHLPTPIIDTRIPEQPHTYWPVGDLGDDADGDIDGYDGGYSGDIDKANVRVTVTSSDGVTRIIPGMKVGHLPQQGLTESQEEFIRMGISVLASEVHEAAVSHGWWDEGLPGQTVGEKFMLMVSEIAEALEADRNHEPPLWYRHAGFLGQGAVSEQPEYEGVLGKPEGACTELADAIIRILDWCQKHDWPIAEALVRKHNYNLTRSHRHGGKAY